jgi:hypothetical protein
MALSLLPALAVTGFGVHAEERVLKQMAFLQAINVPAIFEISTLITATD